MITSLMPVPKQQYFGGAGLPLVGGKVFTFAAGTSTPKPTYTDAAGTVAQANPIPLNARGEPANAIFWSGAYKVVVQDALGNTIYTVDNYNTDPAGLMGTLLSGPWWGGVAASIVAFGTTIGASLLGYIQDGVAAVGRSVQNRLREKVSVFDFMSEAQIADVRARTKTLDVTVALQAAFDYGILKSALVRIPAGDYKVTASILIASGANWQGDGPVSTIINGQGMTTPIFVNKAADFIGYLDLRGFQVQYGSDGFKFNVTSETAYMNFSDILIRYQTGDNFYVNKMLQLAKFIRVDFFNSSRGLICDGFTANLNVWEYCRWGNHVFESVKLVNNEVNEFNVCSFENAAPDASGQFVVNANATTFIALVSSNLQFNTCYAENGHRRFLQITSDGTTQFNNFHFTAESASIPGGPLGYGFAAVDGSVITFNGGSFSLPPRKEGSILFAGSGNAKLYNNSMLVQRSQGVTEGISRDIVEAGPQGAKTTTIIGARDILKIDASSNGTGMILGVLTIEAQTLATGGVSYKQYYGRFRVFASRISGTSVQLVELVPMETYSTPADAAGQITCAVALNATTTTSTLLVLKATIGGLAYEPPAGYGQLTWSFKSLGHSEAPFVPSCG